jgi:hypothetical protein
MWFFHCGCSKICLIINRVGIYDTKLVTLLVHPTWKCCLIYILKPSVTLACFFYFVNTHSSIIMSVIIIVHKFHYSGSKIFSTFIGFLKSKDPSDGTEEALLNELTSFDSYLKDNVSGLVAIVMLHEWFIIVQLFCMRCNICIISAVPFYLSYLHTCLDSCALLHELYHVWCQT